MNWKTLGDFLKSFLETPAVKSVLDLLDSPFVKNTLTRWVANIATGLGGILVSHGLIQNTTDTKQAIVGAAIFLFGLGWTAFETYLHPHIQGTVSKATRLVALSAAKSKTFVAKLRKPL